MAQASPISGNQINRIGRVLAELTSAEVDLDAALQILNAWRLEHAAPTRAIQTRLRHHALKLQKDALVTQRLKRIPSIKRKLRETPSMNLHRMHDIGGCRAVMRNLEQVERLADTLLKTSLGALHMRSYDYIKFPKDSGYRGIHQVYRYGAKDGGKGHLIEVQIRTLMQHAWATAVEIVGLFLRESLKSSKGSEEWLTFFQLAGHEFALLEDRPVRIFPRFLNSNLRRLKRYAKKLDAIERLSAFTISINEVEKVNPKKTDYYLLSLNFRDSRIQITGYPSSDIERANADYLALERTKKADVVLVSAESLAQLKTGYPNYFADAGYFLILLKRVLAQ